MTTCELEREQIGAFLDGELDAGGRAAFEAHLSTCAGCRQALEDQRQLAQAFAELPPVAAPPDFEARFWARIAREREAPAGFGARLRGFFSPVRALALAGATAALLVLLFANLRSTPIDPTVAAVAVEPTRAPAAEPAPALAANAALSPADTDARIVTNVRDFELLQDPEIDAISELDVLEEWDDAGSS
jgi:anti-sigma factor RsiW